MVVKGEFWMSGVESSGNSLLGEHPVPVSGTLSANVPDLGTFPASAATPGQAESRAAHERFRELDRIEGLSWWDDYVLLRREGWDWRKAVYIAWESSPRVNRWPGNQELLATEVLGLRSDRTIRKWREKWPELDDRIAQLQAAPLMQHRRDVFDALVAMAGMADPRAHPDRKLFLEMTGDYRPKGALALTGEDGGPLEIEYVNDWRGPVFGETDSSADAAWGAADDPGEPGTV